MCLVLGVPLHASLFCFYLCDWFLAIHMQLQSSLTTLLLSITASCVPGLSSSSTAVLTQLLPGPALLSICSISARVFMSAVQLVRIAF